MFAKRSDFSKASAKVLTLFETAKSFEEKLSFLAIF